MVYVAGGTLGMDHSPEPLVVVTRSAWVPLLTRCTVASGTLAPLASVTVPAASELELACE